MLNPFKRIANRLKLSLPKRVEKPSAPPRKLPSLAHRPEWTATIDGQTLTCRAQDKSTARARFKLLLGLQRLPVGTQIHKLPVMADAA